MIGGLRTGEPADAFRSVFGMLARKFTPGFICNLHHKDLGIMMSAVLVAHGHGVLDNTALLGLIEQLSGRESTN